MQTAYLDAIRTFEGFAPQARWDYAQFTNGYGTRARFPGEVIDRAEADRRFQAEIASARAIVDTHAKHLDEGTKAALTSLTFNAGESWVRSGLGDAVRRGDIDAIRSIFVQYNKAGGEVLPGLVSRRTAEALWIGNPDAGVGSQPAAGPFVAKALPAQGVPGTSDDVQRASAGLAAEPDRRAVRAALASALNTRSVLSGEAASAGTSVLHSYDAAAELGSTALSDASRLMTLDLGADLLKTRSEREKEREAVRNA